MMTSNTLPEPHAPLDHIPAGVLCAADYERLADRFIAQQSLAYIQGGSGHDVTARANVQAFQRWLLRPRLLRDVRHHGHTRTQLAGIQLEHPLLLAPVAFQKLAHPDAEAATARAAQATDTPMVLSTLSTCTLEAVAQAADPARWFQLYLQPQREDTLALLRRAEAAGYQAIVLTLDATIQSPSLRALRAGFQMPADCTAANLRPQPAAPITLEAGDSRIFQGLMAQAPRSEDLDWLMAQTRLPIWVKGVLHPDDALQLKVRGVAGVVVSNHGGRTLDGVLSSLQALPEVRSAVGPDFPLLFDGGIRSGSDVFKALALGANAVMIGRLQMYALSVAGALGVAHMLKLLREELEVCMAQTGCATVSQITIDALAPHPGVHPC